MTKPKVTAVSYLNTKPLLFGLLKGGMEKEIDLQLDIPSECAKKLASGEADLGLVPVAVIPQLTDPHIISNYCIGSVGAVRTVCLFSECPIEEIEEVYLDYHSRTSVELVQVLFMKYWKLNPVFLPGKKGFEENIHGKTAGLVIGDRAIGLEGQFPFVYDLGEAWTDFTGLPFVYAAWVANREMPKEFIDKFNDALAAGVENIPNLMLILPSPVAGFDLEDYFTRNISYELDTAKKEGLDLFLKLIKEPKRPPVQLAIESNLL